MRGLTFASVLSLLPLHANAAEPYAPATYVDKGVCPFECCTYREWGVELSTPLLRKPVRGSKVIRTLQAGSQVNGLTGFVEITRPGRLSILRNHVGESGVRYQKGDIAYVYTYLGEGYFRIWYDGKFHDEEVSFMLHGLNDSWLQCAENETCWGKRLSSPKSVWWVKIKAPDGVRGWSMRPEDFSNKDACG